MAEPNGGDSGKRRPAGNSGPCRPRLLLDRLYTIVCDGTDFALARLLSLLLLTTGPMTDDTSCSVVSCPLLPLARSVLHSGRASSSTSTWQGWAACASVAFALLMMLYCMLASTASCSLGVSWEVRWLWAFIVGVDFSSRWCYSWAPWVFLGRSSALAASFISVWWRWMARGFTYFVAFVLFTVIYYGMTWTTWRSLACASRRLLAFPAWLHLLRRLRGPCGALLHDGVGCSELDGWCPLTFFRFVGADAGPLRQSWQRFALGPLCPARVFNYLVAFVPLAVTCCEMAWTASSSLAGASWCPLAFSAWLHQLRRLRDPGGALLHPGLGCSELVGFDALLLCWRCCWATSALKEMVCASRRLLAFLAWLHLLRRPRGPCGALLHDGVGCSELDGWCSLTSSCFVWCGCWASSAILAKVCFGPLCPARVFNYLVAFVPLAVTHGEMAWTARALWLVLPGAL